MRARVLVSNEPVEGGFPKEVRHSREWMVLLRVIIPFPIPC